MTRIFNRVIQYFHTRYVHDRRTKVIASEIEKLVDDVDSILDVGCGDGSISRLLMDKRKKLRIVGTDILQRQNCQIPFTVFDGYNLPRGEYVYDAVMLIDVLHHAEDIETLLKNARDNAGKYIIIKDHIYKSKLDFTILKFMDWIGNTSYGVKVIYNFQTEEYWRQLFDHLGLDVVTMKKTLPIYPGIFNLIFGRGMHFLALLRVEKF